MGSMFKSPKAPDPINVGQVTQQAAGQNTKSAYENAAFNRLDQKDQFGNTLNYSQTGVDAQGNPIFGASQELGATGQQFAGGLGGLGQQYMDRAGQGIETSDGAMNRAYDAATSFSAPRQQREREQEMTRLTNMGHDPSNEAYKNSLMDQQERFANTNNTLAAQLQGQMFTQGLQGRQQGMQELTPGMQYGMGTLNPNYAQVPQVGVQNVDVAGLNQANYQGQMDAYKAAQANQGAMLGGLASIGGTLAKPLMQFALPQSSTTSGGSHGYMP